MWVLATTTKSFKTATACTHTLVAVGIYYTQQEVIWQFPVVVSSPVVISAYTKCLFQLAQL